MHKKTRKHARKHARKDNPAKKKHSQKRARKDNPTKKRVRRHHARRANPAPKRRKARKTHTHRTAKTVQRSVVAYSSHPRKKNPAKRRAKRGGAFKRAVTRAKRVKNPSRKRHHARRRHARYDNPAHKKHARRRHYGKRRSNPSHAGVGMATAGYMDLVVVGLSVVGGMVFADMLDRFVATRSGAKGKPFYGTDAMLEIHAPPDAMRLIAQGGLSVLSIVGAAMAHKKGHKQAAEVLAGIGIGAAAHATLQLVNDKLMGAVFKVDAAKPESLANRLYPDLQTADLEAASKLALDKRNATAGAPRSAPQRVSGPQGSPRVVSAPPAQRPAPSTVGCGADLAGALQLRAAQQRIADLEAKLSNSTASPPADATMADAPRTNVSSIAKRLNRFA